MVIVGTGLATRALSSWIRVGTLAIYTFSQSIHRTCGSELARDSGGSANIDAECNAAIASKLAPTLIALNFLAPNIEPVSDSNVQSVDVIDAP
jgi:hypothetical protein